MAKTITSTRAKWPSDAPERRSVASLVPYARNARTHSDAQVAQIAASIREWGWTNPVLIDETGRQCLAIELAPEYVDVAVKRWQAFTGKDATLDGTDRTFNEIAEERHVPA